MLSCCCKRNPRKPVEFLVNKDLDEEDDVSSVIEGYTESVDYQAALVSDIRKCPPDILQTRQDLFQEHTLEDLMDELCE